MTARARLLALALLAAGLPAQAANAPANAPANATANGQADAPPGATMCSGCHLPAGSVTTSIPVINGRDSVEIATIMEEFRGGKRPATVMDRISKGFAPDEVQAIAAWLAEQK